MASKAISRLKNPPVNVKCTHRSPPSNCCFDSARSAGIIPPFILKGAFLVNTNLLETRQLVKKYSGRTVVDKVNISVGQRSIVGLLGRNGAGKTTTFRMVIGMIVPDGGSVIFEGNDVTKLAMYKRARLGMGYLSQEPSVFQRLTVRDNLRAILETMSITRAERDRRADILIDRFGLREVLNSQARLLSGGERRKLEIARAMVTNPSLILLDEPFSGVDPITVQDLQAEIRRLVNLGVSILITDHNVERTLEVADKAYIIDHGKVIGSGTPKEIIRNELVRKSYLGSTFKGDEFDEKEKSA
ncbi:MAG: LPS export ABC transporter ATP-binding protein [Planctomycetota bacterium]|nr:MAG: LPS export ABC transporter ATP-binding protein [Planctomycetota bacterium]